MFRMSYLLWILPMAICLRRVEIVPYEEMHVFLQKLIDEHKDISKELNNFEEILLSIQENGIEKETNSKLRDFFQFIDNHSIPHHQKEEKFSSHCWPRD